MSQPLGTHTRQFYLLALFAVKLNSDPDAGLPGVPFCALGDVIDSSIQDARRRGYAKLLENCPIAEGWSGHCVSATPFTRALALRIARDATTRPEAIANSWPSRWL